MKKEYYKYVVVFFVVAYVIVLWIMLHFLHLYNIDEDGTNVLSLIALGVTWSFTHPFAIWKAFANPGMFVRSWFVTTGIFAFVVVYVAVTLYSKRHEDIYTAKGSARFLDNKKDYKMLAEKYELPKVVNEPKAPDPNIILSKNVKYGLKPKENVNVTIIGSAGSGKSFGIIKPNLMQMNSSYVITDPSGEIFHSIGKMLLEAGYNVKIFSTTNMAFSHCYNPFDYCYDEEGHIDETRVSTMITLFLRNATESKKQGGGDPFWEKSSKALLSACAMYLLEFRPEEEHNMYQVLRMVQDGKVDESKSSAETKLDKRFTQARKENPEAHCFSSYDTFKLAPAKTANSILISAAVDLNMFDQDRVRNLTTTDYYVKSRSAANGQIRKYLKDEYDNPIRTDKNIDLRTIGDEKTAIFVMTPQANPTYNFLVTMFYSQLFEVLYGRGESLCPKKYMVVGNGGYPVLSMIDSEEDAKTLIGLYKGAVVEKDENDDDAFYICNKAADRRFLIPGLDSTKGVLKKVYSKEVGEKFIAEFEGAKIEHGSNRLPWHVQCLLDEFSNIGEIPEFPQKLATSRKYEISAMIVLQSLAQLKNRYDKLWGDVISNCNVTVFLGTKDPETCEWVSKNMGNRTTRVEGSSLSSKGGNQSYSLDSRELAKPDEVARLDKKKCYIMITGEQPIMDYKYMATDHVRWEDTGDKNPENAMSPEDLVVCTEKKLSRHGDAWAMIDSLQNAIKSLNAKGEPAVKQTRAATRPQSTFNAGGTAKTVIEPAAIKKNRPKVPITDYESAEDGADENFGRDSDFHNFIPKHAAKK